MIYDCDTSGYCGRLQQESVLDLIFLPVAEVV